jgi:succinoglycan biosynthesis transport protein ExoP
MDTNDSVNANLPARQFRESSRLPSLPMAPVSGSEAESGATINREVLLRGLARHWWHILVVWLLVAAPVCYVIYSQIQPTYEAFSILRVEPNTPILYNGSSTGRNDGETRIYMETQVNLMTSDRVLEPAVAHVLVRDRPMIRKSLDPKMDLRQKMDVQIVRGTYLIRVALESGDPDEAATIVNQVVESFKEQHDNVSQSKNKALRDTYNIKLKELLGDADREKQELKTLVKQGNPDLRLATQRAASQEADGKTTVVGATVTEQQFMDLTRKVTDCDIELIGLKAQLDTLQKEQELALSGEVTSEAGVKTPELEKRIKDEFSRDPDVGAIAGEIKDLKTKLEHQKGIIRGLGDPSIKRIRDRIASLESDYEAIWYAKYDEIANRLMTGRNSSNQAAGPSIPQLVSKIKSLEKNRADLESHLATMNVRHKDQGTDTVEAADRQRKILSLQAREDQIRDKLEQIDFESKHENYRVFLQDAAAVPKAPSSNKRTRYLIAAPVVLLIVMVGLFLMLEISSERVADPKSLSTRVQSEVYALPPLPTSKQNMLEADEQIEQFIQRLDHVRFAVCGSQATGLDKGRCVLITSAIGGEGKTTLAAQLAARCGNAGVSTLLIDADLRRTSLCELLDIPEGPGLSDALKDGVPVEDLVIPVQGGTFYLLPAGTPVQDTSRVLQSRRFAELMTQFRQVYDLIIVDSPPVLPVPDALIVGQWVDGAVLSARYDVSRSPQVERARRQLDSAGIPVLGTVINGMRNTDAYYGRYSYSRRRSNSPTDSADVI